jgi:hypothetical protein
MRSTSPANKKKFYENVSWKEIPPMRNLLSLVPPRPKQPLPKNYTSVFVVFASILFPSLSAAATWPQLALGGGYQVTLIVSNQTNFEWRGTFSPRQGLDQRWAGAWAANGQNLTGRDGFTITLPARSTGKIILTGDATTRTGYLEFDGEGTSSDRDVAVSYFYNYIVAGQTLDSTGSPVGDSHRGFRFPVEKTALVNTGVAMAPWLNRSDFPIIATLYSSDGNLFQQKILTFNGHSSRFFDQIFDGVPNGFLGMVQLESSNFFYLEVLRLEQTATGFQLTSTPADSYAP